MDHSLIDFLENRGKVDNSQLVAVVAHDSGVVDDTQLSYEYRVVVVPELDGSEGMAARYVPQVDAALPTRNHQVICQHRHTASKTKF